MCTVLRSPIAMSIPRYLRHTPRSLELASLHEAGHVLMLLSENIVPEFVEVRGEPRVYGRTRAAVVSGASRRGISSAGLAVEISLFEAGRLVDATGRRISEKVFLDEAVGKNAAEDKRMFFGENRADSDGYWPKDDDEYFISFAQNVKAVLDMDFVEDLATELMETGRLETEAIQTIADRHGL
jgi:hypothetical protein